MHRVYCKSVSESNKKFLIDESQSHHLIKALRIKKDSLVEIFDGKGKSAECKVIKLSRKICEVERVGVLKSDISPKRTLTTVIPVIKKSNFNFMIEKLAEVGVNKFIIYRPDLVDQSVAKKDLTRMIKKSSEIIINVSKQCGNNFLPDIEESKSLNEAIKLLESSNQAYIFDTEASEYFNQQELGINSSVTIITGPESGFSDNELKLIDMQNIKKRYLGENILRAETAPIFVSSLVKNHFGKI